MKKIILFVVLATFAIVSQAQLAIKVSVLMDSTFVWNERQPKEQFIKNYMIPYYSDKKMNEGTFIVTKLGNESHLPALFFQKADITGPKYIRSIVLFPNSVSEARRIVDDLIIYYHTYLPMIGYKTEVPATGSISDNMLIRTMKAGRTDIQMLVLRKHPIYGDRASLTITYTTEKNK